MSHEKRLDFYRAVTFALTLTTAVLVITHFKGRVTAMKEASEEVRKIHDRARNAIVAKVDDLRARLSTWERDASPPEGFTQVLVSGASAPPGMRPVSVRARTNQDRPAGNYWVYVSNAETELSQEGEFVVEASVPGGEPQGVILNFPGGGRGTFTVKKAVPDPPVEGAPPVPLEVLLRRGTAQEEPLGPPLSVRGPASGSYALQVDDAIRTTRHTVNFRTPPGSPRLRVTWTASIGERGGPELVIGVLRAFPEREVKAGVLRNMQRVPETVILPGESAMVLGSVPLQGFKDMLEGAGILETARWGDRLYLTDVSGTVAQAIPDYQEKIRHRAGLEGRASLTSLATQRVKVGGGETEVYEGFSKDRVVGAFGTLDAIQGGLIVEREEKMVLEAYRGLQAWHVAGVLLGLLLLVPFVPPVVRRIREDTELPRLWAYAREFLPHLVVIIVTAAIYAAGQGIFAYQGKVITDEVLVNPDTNAYVRLREICWLLVAVSAVMFVVNWIKEYLGKVIQNRLVMELRCALCEKIVNLPMAFHARQRAGDLLSRISNDVAETNRGLEMLFGDVISDPILIVTLTGSAFFINWRLALVVFVGLPVILLPISYFGQKIKKHARKRQARKADVTQSISQMLSGIKVVKAFRMEEHEVRQIRGVSGHFLVEALRVARAQVTSKEILEFFSNLSIAVIGALGGYMVLEKQVTIGDLSAFGLIIGRMYRSSKNLTGNYNKMQETLAGTERIFEVIDTPDTMADRPAARALVRPRETIAFENVSFRYADDSPWVLRGVSVKVPVGTSLALVGATGAGKSTMLDLVARFYDPGEGRVSIDGVDLRDFSRTSLLSHVAMVTQEAFLFNASIAENIRYGRPGATQAEIEAAARAAFVHEEILKQPEGYETNVGERGTRLSGGQRQRVTIARAILKDPPILILDEATSALDSRSEEMVQNALANLMKDRTTFVIAHRLSTIQNADRILVLDGGRLMEQGTHQELVGTPGGLYRRLYEIQFASALRSEPGAATA